MKWGDFWKGSIFFWAVGFLAGLWIAGGPIIRTWQTEAVLRGYARWAHPEGQRTPVFEWIEPKEYPDERP